MEFLSSAAQKYRESGLRGVLSAAPSYGHVKLRNACGRTNKLYHSRGGRRVYNTSGDAVLEENWDNLIVLDAFRFDTFQKLKERYSLPGTLEQRTSRGSKTPEWVYGNFSTRESHDIVYVTSSSYPYHIGVADPEHQDYRQKKWGLSLDVHRLVDVWRKDVQSATENGELASYLRGEQPEEENSIENDLQTELYSKTFGQELSELVDFWVPPGKELRDTDHIDDGTPANETTPPWVTHAAARQTAAAYPDKRLLVHFIPPHWPFYGETGKQMHERTDYINPLAKFPSDDSITREMLEAAYEENAILALYCAMSLAEKLDGKTVITSDHGELLGDRTFPLPIRQTSHPPHMYVPELVTVPWLVLDGKRRDIVPEPPEQYNERESLDDESHSQLAALGYVEE